MSNTNPFIPYTETYFFKVCQFFAKDVYGLNRDLSELSQNNNDTLWTSILITGKKYFSDSRSGFSGSVYYNKTKNILVVSLRGTEITLPQDLIDDVDLSNSYSPIDYEAARAFLDSVLLEIEKQKLNPDLKIVLTGHSLGGGLAQLCGAEKSWLTLTFNAVGMRQLINNIDIMNYIPADPANQYNNIINYALTTDIVSNAFIPFGRQLFALGPPKPLNNFNPSTLIAYYLKSHSEILSDYTLEQFTIDQQTEDGRLIRNAAQHYPWLLKSVDLLTQVMCHCSETLSQSFGDFPLTALHNFFHNQPNIKDFTLKPGNLSKSAQFVSYDSRSDLSVLKK